MIDIAQLRTEDIGRWVEYKGGAGEKERGRIKSWNNSNIFVVYKCAGEWDRFQDFAAAATSPQDLRFVEHLTAGRECPDHEGGHAFIPCDDLPATCTCGKQENEP